MPRRITIIDGHPDPANKRFCHALADAYAKGALQAGHEVHRITLSELVFDDLSRRDVWETEPAASPIADVQGDIAWCHHLVILYPLWLGSMPARLKALFELTFRPGFAFGQRERIIGLGRLKGRTARVIVTCGMPAAIYRWFYCAHSLRSLKRNILVFVGIGPVRDTVIGNVENLDEDQGQRWIHRIEALGARGS